MQSPLTPQRGRIESNPREYTHMGPRHCGELETMPADRRSLAVRPPHERGYLDARAWKIGRSPNESGYLDGICRKSPKNRPNIHSRYPTVRKSLLVR